MNSEEKIIIIGAGLCGSLLAIRLAQRGYNVSLFEKQADMRKVNTYAGRSINLALSDRGLMALETVGLKEKVMRQTIPMKGRLIHPLDMDAFMSPYSGRTSSYINSVSRPGLNIILLNEIESFDNIKLKFNAKITNVDLKAAQVEYIENGERKSDSGTVVIGTDGAGSIVRRSMMQHSTELLFNYSQNFLHHGYKELSIDPDKDGGWQIEKEALHIWPRGDFMIIALPNLDGSFTLTMFHPFGSANGFDALDDKEKVTGFFEKYYPSLLPYIPNYLEEYFSNPIGKLGTIKCYPWQAFGKVLIMGDASHAIVPFYGQGMNASLEDVRIFDQLLNEIGNDWTKLFEAFQLKRKENTDAIADLAIDNFYEMRDHVDDVAFKRKRSLEMELEKKYPDYSSKYSLVTFNPEISYRSAMMRGRKQDELLLQLCQREDYNQLNLDEIYESIKNSKY